MFRRDDPLQCQSNGVPFATLAVLGWNVHSNGSMQRNGACDKKRSSIDNEGSQKDRRE